TVNPVSPPLENSNSSTPVHDRSLPKLWQLRLVCVEPAPDIKNAVELFLVVSMSHALIDQWGMTLLLDSIQRRAAEMILRKNKRDYEHFCAEKES
ncbi:unnamed protein product, partial [Amoebophrya sp. A25]